MEEPYQNPVHVFSAVPRGVPLPHGKALLYYVKREKCKVNDVIFSSGEAHAIFNQGNMNMKIGIFTGGTSVRSKNIFTATSRYPIEKHEIKKTIPEVEKVSLVNIFYLSHWFMKFCRSVKCRSARLKGLE